MEKFYLVSYDICDQKRWRRLYKTMRGYGQWLQLSVFQCRLDKIRLLQLEALIREIINREEDHVLIVDLGPAERITPKVTSIGRPFEPLERKAIIV